MKISPAKAHQISSIFDILKRAKKALEEEFIFQWHDEYPNIEIVAGDVKKKNLYTCRVKNSCAGIITLSEEQDEEYAAVNWKDKDGRALIVHRLAVDPAYQRQGIARRLMDFAEGYALQNKYSSIRLDAFSANKRAMKFYENRKYEKRGEIYFPKRELPFFCYEKILGENAGNG